MLEEQVKNAAREFLRTVITKVPIYSGEARGTLQPLGRFLRVPVPTTGVPAALRKSPGHDAASGALQSSFEFDLKDGFKPRFKFDVTLAHFITNEYHTGLPEQKYLKWPTPWGAIAAGRASFKRYLDLTLKRSVPHVKDFTVYTWERTQNG